MPHVRTLIVAAAVELLKTCPTPLGRVKSGRAAPMPVAQAPYLLVYGRPERSAPLAGGRETRKLLRELTLAIEIVTASADDNDDQVNAIAAEVERALAAQPSLGGLSKDLWLAATTPDARADGEVRVGRARLEFTVQYVTVASAPDQAA
jgi:hypothetical protein